jgi:hypothetical protein
MVKSKPKLKVDTQTRFEVFARANYLCEKCLDAPIAGVSVHHRRPRMMGGSRNELLHQPANLILLCGSGTTGCHGWVESNRDKAREQGYLIQKVESAEQVPFRDNSGIWWNIYNSGDKVQLDINRAVPHF